MGGVKLLRLDSIDSLRIETCKAESFHRNSIFLVYKYGGCEVTAIRVDSIDSLRIDTLWSRIVSPEVDIPGIQVWGVWSYAIRVDSIDSLRIELVKPNLFTGSRYSWYTSMWGVKLCDSSRFGSLRTGTGDVKLLQLDSIDSLRIETCKAESFHRNSIFLVYKYGGCEVTAIRVDSIDSLRIEPPLWSRIVSPEVDIPGIQVWGVWSYAIRVDSIDSLRIELVKPNLFTGSRYSWYTSMWGVKLCDSSRFGSLRTGTGDVKLLQLDSIDSLRIETCKAESFHRNSIFLVYKYGGCEVTAIRVDSIDSLRIEPCEAESFHRKSIFLVYKYGGCEVMRFESIRSIRCESNL